MEKPRQKENWDMEMIRRKIVWITFVLAASLLFCGCATEEQMAQEVSFSRDTAYRQWKNRKQREESSQPRISGQLSVQDCLKITLVNNKKLQAVVQEREVARGERLKSYSSILPSASVAGEYRRHDKVTSF
jgi:hypothetical protein